MILLLDTESGSLSVDHYVRSGDVDVRRCEKFKDVESAFWEVQRGRIKPDLIAVDTLTTLATTTRHDIIVDPEQMGDASLWQHRGKLTAAQRDWGNMSDLINRLMRMIRSLPVPTVFICHEGEREDPQYGINKLGPDLNASILRDVIAFSDALVRLSYSADAFKVGEKDYAPGTRVLRLASNATAMAKVRVPEDVPQPPSIVPDPTWTSFVAALGGVMPQKTTIYGSSGSGKTRLVGSVVEYFRNKKAPTNTKAKAAA